MKKSEPGFELLGLEVAGFKGRFGSVVVEEKEVEMVRT